MEEIIDIYSKGEYPANVLSNFYPRDNFVYDGIKIASAESFLQSLKFKNPKKQIKICALDAKTAKKKGSKKFLWKITGNVYWKGKKWKRLEDSYMFLIYNFYIQMHIQDDTFAIALNKTGTKTLIHSIGKHDKRKTILTEEEFIDTLEQLRAFC